MTNRSRPRAVAVALALLLATGRAAQAGEADNAAVQTAAVDDADAAALDLADRSAAASAAPADVAKPWKFDVQNALRMSRYRDGGEGGRNQLSIEFDYAQWLTPSFGAHVSMRFDRFDPLGSSRTSSRNETLVKEAYASWRATPAFVVDAGRINERLGAAIGYNPTDFFRAGAVSLDVPPDPDSRHTNRLGTVALRAQHVWASGSVALLASPRLASRSVPGDPDASSDLQRTNGVDRWMLVASQRLGALVQPQWVVYGESGQSPQFGQNLSVLAGDAVVAYLEWAGGYRPSLIARDRQRRRSRVSHECVGRCDMDIADRPVADRGIPAQRRRGPRVAVAHAAGGRSVPLGQCGAALDRRAGTADAPRAVPDGRVAQRRRTASRSGGVHAGRSRRRPAVLDRAATAFRPVRRRTAMAAAERAVVEPFRRDAGIGERPAAGHFLSMTQGGNP